MRNKLASLFLVFVVLCTLGLNLAGCGKTSDDATTTAETTSAPATTAVPATTETPATTAAQTTEQPTTTAAPATTEAPATTAAPATTDGPATTESATADLMEGIVPKTNSGADATVSATAAATAADFAVRLFKNAYDGKNTLLSPLSILSALAMTANGAKGETLSQMLTAFGVSSIDELNEFFAAYLDNLPASETCKLSLANSIWLRDSEYLVVKEEFLQTNADYYRAAAYRSPFDNQTLNDINQWVYDNTDGMIDKILDDISPLSMLYLINALAFDGKWATPYEESDQIIENGSFRKEDGTDAKVTYLADSEYRYLVDEDLAVGFSKPYADQRFAFVALRPNDGVTVEEYMATLTGEKIVSLLQNAKQTEVETWLPKFETRYFIELKGVLSAMGMPIAFTNAADFTGITDSVPLQIDDVLHKTYISVGEQGTRAAAVTVVEMKVTAVAPEFQPPKVYLDRSFVYMLVDTETNFPLFIGALNDPTK